MLQPYPALDRCEHNAEWECASCTTLRHELEHAERRDDCWACKLLSVRIMGRFTGPASTSDAVQQFWATGDPSVFDRQDRAAALAREERRTRIG